MTSPSQFRRQARDTHPWTGIYLAAAIVLGVLIAGIGAGLLWLASQDSGRTETAVLGIALVYGFGIEPVLNPRGWLRRAGWGCRLGLTFILTLVISSSGTDAGPADVAVALALISTAAGLWWGATVVNTIIERREQLATHLANADHWRDFVAGARASRTQLYEVRGVGSATRDRRTLLLRDLHTGHQTNRQVWHVPETIGGVLALDTSSAPVAQAPSEWLLSYEHLHGQRLPHPTQTGGNHGNTG